MIHHHLSSSSVDVNIRICCILIKRFHTLSLSKKLVARRFTSMKTKLSTIKKLTMHSHFKTWCLFFTTSWKYFFFSYSSEIFFSLITHLKFLIDYWRFSVSFTSTKNILLFCGKYYMTSSPRAISPFLSFSLCLSVCLSVHLSNFLFLSLYSQPC